MTLRYTEDGAYALADKLWHLQRAGFVSFREIIIEAGLADPASERALEEYSNKLLKWIRVARRVKPGRWKSLSIEHFEAITSTLLTKVPWIRDYLHHPYGNIIRWPLHCGLTPLINASPELIARVAEKAKGTYQVIRPTLTHNNHEWQFFRAKLTIMPLLGDDEAPIAIATQEEYVLPGVRSWKFSGVLLPFSEFQFVTIAFPPSQPIPQVKYLKVLTGQTNVGQGNVNDVLTLAGHMADLHDGHLFYSVPVHAMRQYDESNVIVDGAYEDMISTDHVEAFEFIKIGLAQDINPFAYHEPVVSHGRSSEFDRSNERRGKRMDKVPKRTLKSRG